MALHDALLRPAPAPRCRRGLAPLQFRAPAGASAKPGTASTRTVARYLLAIEDVRGQDLDAVYAIGPGIDENEPAEWSRRKGHLVDDEFVFDEKGKSTLRFRPRADGGLSATWTSPDGKTSMQAGLRSLNLSHLSRRADAR